MERVSEKSTYPVRLASQKRKEINLAAAYRVVGVSRQSVYQAVSRMECRRAELSIIKDWVLYWRKFMPQIGTA